MIKKYTLDGIDGNAYSIMSYVVRVMRETMKYTGYTKEDIDSYVETATSGDYDDLIWESMVVLNAINARIVQEGVVDEDL